MTDTAVTPVPFDPEIAPILDFFAANPQPPLSWETLPATREGMSSAFPQPLEAIGNRAVETEELVIPGPAGAPDLEITVFKPRGHTPASEALPGLFNIHGGGMIVGHRHWESERLIQLVLELGVVAVNVEYRLAPEHPFPAGVEDCYAGVSWMSQHASELGVDPARIVIMGGSAGGGFSAAVSLMARDRSGPALAGQLLLCPMLDNSNSTVASYQYDGIGTWMRDANLLAWRCVLGEELAYSTEASQYAAPTRATDLSGLPPAFIEAGAAEMFRDEDVDYATRIWATGGNAELHIWAGGFHGFDIYAPESEITRAALAARHSWLRRVLSIGASA